MAERRIKGNVSIRKSWAEGLGELERELFLSERVNAEVITISVLEWDVSTIGSLRLRFNRKRHPIGF